MPASQPTNQPTHQTTSHNRHNGRDARLNCGGWRYPMIAAAALAALAATIPSVSLVHHAPERVEACLRLPSTHPRPNVFGRDRCQSTVRATQIRPVSELAGKLSALLHRPSHAEVVVRVDGVLRNVVKGDASKAAFCCSRASRSLLASKHSDSCWRRSTAILAGVEAQRQPASSPPPQSQTSAASACSRSAASRAARSAASACCFWTCPRWAFLSGELPQQLEAGPTAGVEALLPP